VKFLSVSKDGGPESSVWAYWLFEAKALASVALLRFVGASREAYHSHAFDCVSWIIRGELREQHLDGALVSHKPSLRPVITRRATFHKVDSVGTTWVLTFRGPWARTWLEFLPASGEVVRLANGRRVEKVEAYR
jgi:hypothetical protein